MCVLISTNNNDLFAEFFNSKVIYLLEGKRANIGSVWKPISLNPELARPYFFRDDILWTSTIAL